MERFLEINILNEIFIDDESIGGLQEYADRVRQLHHRFLEAQLVPERSTTQLESDELLRFAGDAEFLATQYTNPLVVQRTEGLPTEDVPSSQLVQDALSLAGTIFEFLGDTVAQYENQNERQEICENLGRSALLYLKSALCYALGMYESRTYVILKRVLKNLQYPNEPLTLENWQEWADYLIFALLGRNLRQILRAVQFVEEQTSNIRSLLVRAMALESLSVQSERLSPQSVTKITTSLSLIDAALYSAKMLVQGESSLIDKVQNSLSNAIKSAYQLADYEQIWIIRTLSKVLVRMWSDSPWVRLSGIINRRNYIKKLVEDGVVTLWSSQVAALEMRSRLGVLKGGYLDERIKRVVIHMPTSAGKTLLAELAIAYRAFSDSGSKCVYVGPSRSLCDQVSADLTKRLASFGVRVTALVSDSDSSDYESILFRQANVIVVTPEKLSYLFRQKNKFVLESGLFIFDELHNIGRHERGWTYEELISLLLKHPQTSNAKMLFLSAVMPNHLTVQEWVDPEKLGDTISELWQPTRLLKGAIIFQTLRRKPQQREVILPGNLIYVRHKEDLNSPLRIDNIIESRQFFKEKTTKGKGSGQLGRDSKLSDNELTHAVAAAGRFASLGPVLVYCPKKVDATGFCEQALQLDLSFLRWRDGEENRYQEVIEFIRDRFPGGHPLINALEHRIGFHHAGLPRDVRNEIEFAFSKGWIHVLAATTTLVEGVNLPVKTLIILDYCQKRYWDNNHQSRVKLNPLSKSDFKNIAGRAGRALYDTEGQVVFIQSIDGYNGYAYPLDTDFEKYLNLEPDSLELCITSTLANEGVLAYLSHLVEKVDNGELSEQQLLFEMDATSEKSDPIKLVKKLQTFSLLLQAQGLVGEAEESFVQIFQGTFLGKQRPSQTPHIVGAFSHRSAKAISSLISQADRTLFAETGLKIPTCRLLMERVRAYWEERKTTLNNFLNRNIDRDIIYKIAEVIYELGDDDVDPQSLTLAREGKGSKTKQRLTDEKAFLADWILNHDTQTLLNTHFSFIKDLSWRAEQYVDYTQQTLAYRTPWTLSAFWLFSKAITENLGVNLVDTCLGRELLLLPAYAKFGVNTPAAALFSTFGISPSQMARQLGELYEERQGKIARYDYLKMLDWLLRIEAMELEASNNIQPSYIRRLMRLLESLRPLEEIVQESERIWQVNFPIAGWQYYEGESILQTLRVGDTLVLKPEPDNRYDPNAVEIVINRAERQVKLGYVPRYLAPDVKDRIDIRPIRATISEISPSAPLQDRIHVFCSDIS